MRYILNSLFKTAPNSQTISIKPSENPFIQLHFNVRKPRPTSDLRAPAPTIPVPVRKSENFYVPCFHPLTSSENHTLLPGSLPLQRMDTRELYLGSTNHPQPALPTCSAHLALRDRCFIAFHAGVSLDGVSLTKCAPAPLKTKQIPQRCSGHLARFQNRSAQTTSTATFHLHPATHNPAPITPIYSPFPYIYL